MGERYELTTVPMVCFSWLSATMAVLLAVVVAVLGQALGAMLGGCEWIGATLPLHQQPWALVNQPELNFSRQAAAAPYWLGSVVLPLLVASVIMPLLVRTRSFATEICAVQISWGCVVVGGAWLPLLDPRDGHVSRWLYLHEKPPHLVWLVLLLALLAGLVPVLRLMKLARSCRRDAPRQRRLSLVILHLGVPILAWVVLVSVLRGAVPVAPTVAACIPLLGALLLAHLWYPSYGQHSMEGLDAVSFGGSLVALFLLATLIWFAGRPLPKARAAGVLWSGKEAYNNVRVWVAETYLVRPGAD